MKRIVMLQIYFRWNEASKTSSNNFSLKSLDLSLSLFIRKNPTYDNIFRIWIYSFREVQAYCIVRKTTFPLKCHFSACNAVEYVRTYNVIYWFENRTKHFIYHVFVSWIVIIMYHVHMQWIHALLFNV